ncbi:unnamed protein product [Orchesella dallaii]|uniref:CCHC-type domain-containing protein n=1 Tax=Orchesella dallaii TaxID=48710 RepID=A0ABP1S8A1_9HEXA
MGMPSYPAYQQPPAGYSGYSGYPGQPVNQNPPQQQGWTRPPQQNSTQWQNVPTSSNQAYRGQAPATEAKQPKVNPPPNIDRRTGEEKLCYHCTMPGHFKRNCPYLAPKPE